MYRLVIKLLYMICGKTRLLSAMARAAQVRLPPDEITASVVWALPMTARSQVRLIGWRK